MAIQFDIHGGEQFPAEALAWLLQIQVKEKSQDV